MKVNAGAIVSIILLILGKVLYIFMSMRMIGTIPTLPTIVQICAS